PRSSFSVPRGACNNPASPLLTLWGSHKKRTAGNPIAGGSAQPFIRLASSGLLAIAFLHFLEFGIEHIVLRLFRMPGRAVAVASGPAGSARRRLLVHFLQQRGGCLLERLGLAFDGFPVIAAHGRLDRGNRLARRLLLIVGNLVPDILESLLHAVDGRIRLVARAHQFAELLVL